MMEKSNLIKIRFLKDGETFKKDEVTLMEEKAAKIVVEEEGDAEYVKEVQMNSKETFVKGVGLVKEKDGSDVALKQTFENIENRDVEQDHKKLKEKEKELKKANKEKLEKETLKQNLKDELLLAVNSNLNEIEKEDEIERLTKFYGKKIIGVRKEFKKLEYQERSFEKLGEPKKKVGSIKPSKTIFLNMKKVFKKYLDTSELNYNLLTTWTLGTYFHHQFETYPLLTLMARKQSGKTRTLKLISTLSNGSDGSVSTSVTETHLFRHKEGSIFFDEMESVSSKEKTALRETINAIYKKGNKIVRYTEKRTNEGKEWVEDNFYPFYPLGLANIRGFGDVLEDRSLQLILQRSKKSQTKLIEDFSTNPEILNLKKELEKLKGEIPDKIFSQWNNYVQYGKIEEDRLKDIFLGISKTNLLGRPLEIFFPLFVIGELFGVLEIMLKCSEEYMERLEADIQSNPDDLLQSFIEKVSYEGFVPVSKILQDFRGTMENPEEWINAKWLGRALKRLDLISKKRKNMGKMQVIINSPNSLNTTNSTNSTNSTTSLPTNNLKELGEFRELKGLVDKNIKIKPTEKELKDLGHSEEIIKELKADDYIK